MTSPIQIPYLRPDPIHEGAGLQQAGGEDQLSQLAKLLILKGHLSLEQEKFQAEEGERKQKKQSLVGLSQGLSQILSQPGVMDSPQGVAGAIQQAAPQFAGAGMGPEAAGLMGKLPELQKAQGLSNTQKALGLVMQEYQNQDVMDPRVQARTLGQIYGIDQDAARGFADNVRALHGRFNHFIDGAGQIWVGDTETGKIGKGPLGTPKGGAGAITTQEARTTAQIGAQALANILHIVQSDPQALQVPVAYAGVSNMKGSGGAMGAIGGLLEPLAQTQLTPHQQNVMRFRDQFIETYMALITGKRGAGSPALLNLARNAFFPLANQNDPQVQAAAIKSMRFALTKMQALGAGQVVSFDGLPGYAEAVREGLGMGTPEGPVAPQAPVPGAAQAPLGFSDLLNGPPPVDRKP